MHALRRSPVKLKDQSACRIVLSLKRTRLDCIGGIRLFRPNKSVYIFSFSVISRFSVLLGISVKFIAVLFQRGISIASCTVSKNRLNHQRPPHDSDKNYSPIEGFL